MKKIIFILIACLFGMMSCNKAVLDKVPLNIISDATLWNDQNLIDAYLTNVYTQMPVLTNETPDNGYWTGYGWFGEFAINDVSDECRASWIQTYQAFKLGALKIDGGLLEWWEMAYSNIRMLNEFIERVPNSPVDASFKKERVAEARFLRAFNYFSMVKRYGGVPLITKTQQITDSQESLYPKRDNEQAIYDFVLAECDSILSSLNIKNSPDYGRPTQGAALALKCRAALYAGSIAQFGTVQLNGVIGIDPSKATAYYQQAYTAAKQIINDGNYTLIDNNANKVMNFRNIFVTKNNSEAIFVGTHNTSDGNAGGQGWSYDFMQCPYPDGWGAGNNDAPYLEMVEEFEHTDGTTGQLDTTAIQQGLWTTDQLWANKDPRFFATIYTQNTHWKGILIDYHRGILRPDGIIQTDNSYGGILATGKQDPETIGAFTTGFGVMKYLDESKDNTGERATSGTDFIVFRYAEVFLNLAEAAFELGKTNDALDAINQIRVRAGIAPLTAIDRDKIRHERKVELAFEGQRYWDLRRWRTAVQELSVNRSGLRYVLDYTSGKYKLMVIHNVDGITPAPAFFTRNYYLPITLARTANNKNLVENPGY